MNRLSQLCLIVALVMSLYGCNGLNAIGQQNISGTPTVYAQVNKEPNPTLLGCYLRSRPSEFNRPNKYEYCLTKTGGGYALYYYLMDGKTLSTFKDWSGVTINGDCMTVQYDGATYCAKNGEVFQTTAGSSDPHRMLRMN